MRARTILLVTVVLSILSVVLSGYMVRSILRNVHVSDVDKSPPWRSVASSDHALEVETVQEDVQPKQELPQPELPPASPPPRRTSTFAMDVMKMRQTGAFILPTLLSRIKRAIDVYLGVSKSAATFGKRWPSCAVVGNSGTMIGRGYGPNISAHAAVWRLNLAPSVGFEPHVGGRTMVSFINGHRINYCAKQEKCACSSYGARVPVLVSMWSDFHWQDLRFCREHRPQDKFIIIDATVQQVCSRIVTAYADRRRAREEAELSGIAVNSAPEGVDPPLKRRFPRPDFSSGMEAITVALTLCDRVSIYGFGKAPGVPHHYWENTTKNEYGLHDYAAEQIYFDDLVNGREIPILTGSIDIPPVSFYP
eukprot:CAMPEP_0118941434 /NCGR_PEP_ID=MMETSP1169-20130426/33871_1 /TAXON_ID=36882 /ORGANISM="Pyramimonas obovata, Strain CCMP722" /LENGTH=363 /DNA_ID=CAMNT_0006886183 /DNA_START=187 /DNA_END=1278 /DNA_ORIENTATION=-